MSINIKTTFAEILSSIRRSQFFGLFGTFLGVLDHFAIFLFQWLDRSYLCVTPPEVSEWKLGYNG